jgi:glycosyltransferase involved in cell wall biosynthesis
MRIAFITPEFVTDHRNGGGLGNYLNRMGETLLSQGHEVEVFVSSYLEPQILDHEGMRVNRVAPLSKALAVRILKRIFRMLGLSIPFLLYSQAWALAAAMERRHRVAPFDLVQSADYLAVGLCVRRLGGRVHLVRCSTAADLYNEIDGHNSKDAKWREKLERRTLRRADKAYAPSRFVAEHFRTRHGIPVEVLRPPVGLEVTPSAEVPSGLPERFLIHFGQLSRRKGTQWLGESLKRACEIEPALRMVWIGPDYDNELGAILSHFEKCSSKVWALSSLPKAQLYAVLQRADATVAPSLVDNLPNTVIESLMLGIPVIGTRGASINELVEQGVTGELISSQDVEGLASVIVRFWRGQSSVQKGFTWRGKIVDEMQPAKAVEGLLKLACI